MTNNTIFPATLIEADAAEAPCAGCRNGADLDIAFEFAYQPIVDVAARKVFGHEALVRGPNGESAYSVLSQVNDQNRYKFDQACRVKAVAGAARLGMREYLSINFLPNAVYRPDLCLRTTLAAAKEHDFPIERIIFEVTESEQVRDRKHLVNIFEEYRRFGFMTAIDDFGAGYAGLNLLAEYQPHVAKLDMDLIRGIDTHRPRQLIVSNMVAMCRDLGVRILAEGVETREERDFLRSAGIELMQGYFFSKPVFQGVGAIDPSLWD